MANGEVNGNGGPLPSGIVPGFMELCRRYGPMSALSVALIAFNAYFMLAIYQQQHETDVYLHETMMTALRDATVAIAANNTTRLELADEIHESTEMRKQTTDTMNGVKHILEEILKNKEKL